MARRCPGLPTWRLLTSPPHPPPALCKDSGCAGLVLLYPFVSEETELSQGPNEGASWVMPKIWGIWVSEPSSALGNLREAPWTQCSTVSSVIWGLFPPPPCLGIFGLSEGRVKCPLSQCLTVNSKNPKPHPEPVTIPRGTRSRVLKTQLLYFVQ